MRSIGRLTLALLCIGFAASGQAQESPSTDWDAAKKESEARKAAADADKAEAEAKAAAIKAQLGGIADYKTEGNTTATNNAGQVEAAILSSVATRAAADRIVTEVCIRGPKLCQPYTATSVPAGSGGGAIPASVCDDLATTAVAAAPKLYVFTESEKPSFDAAEGVQAALCGINKKLDAAIANSERLTTGGSSQAFAPAALFTIANVAANLFRTDYSFQGIAVTSDDLLLAKLFVAAASGHVNVPIHVPSIYRPAALSVDNPLMAALVKLDETRTQAARLSDKHKKTAGSLAKGGKAQAARAKANSEVAAALDAAIKSYDDYLAKITTPSDKGVSELAEAARQLRIRNDLASGSYLITLKMNTAGGSSYTKKNFWTFLGGAPFYVSGGTVASYTLIDGQSGAVLGSNAVGIAGGYERIGEIHRR
jgi:hypothetical protein